MHSGIVNKTRYDDLGKPMKQTIFTVKNLERNLSNFSYVFILNMNFENLTIKLYVLIISFMLAKF